MVISLSDYNSGMHYAEGDYIYTHTFETPISGEASLYLSGTIFFQSYDSVYNFDVVNLSTAANFDAYEFGNSWDVDNLTYIKPGPFYFSDALISDGASFDITLKIDQTTGLFDWWLNPNYQLTESQNPIEFSGYGGSTAPITACIFRGGDTNLNDLDPNTDVHYNNFKVYTGDDSPFMTVPEHRLTTLAYGCLGFALVLILRLFRP